MTQTNQASPTQIGSAAEFNQIKSVVAVMSGKGGVGKSFVTGLLASGLAREGYRVGVLDADITGPSIPKLFGLHGPVDVGEHGIEPMQSKLGIKVISMNLLMEREDQPVIWRGPLISQAIKQLYGDVYWGDLDCLLVDLPPGTSDATLTIMQSLPLKGVIMVTTPQSLANLVVTKAVHMAQKMNVPVLGIVENMSYFICPETGSRHEIFGKSQSSAVTAIAAAPLLAQIPINPQISASSDAGEIESLVFDEMRQLVSAFLKIENVGVPLKEPVSTSGKPLVEATFESLQDFEEHLITRGEDEEIEQLSEKARELVDAKANWGLLSSPDARVRIKGCCGDSVQIDLRIEEGLVREARYLTDGCDSSKACCEAVATLAKGKSLDAALKISSQDVIDMLGDISKAHEHCAKLASMALRHVIEKYRKEHQV